MRLKCGKTIIENIDVKKRQKTGASNGIVLSHSGEKKQRFRVKLDLGMRPKNYLLERLPHDVYSRIEPDMERLSLPVGQIIHAPGEPIHSLYFPLTCMISITVTMTDGRTVETGMVGSREVVGINAFMGGRETTHTEYVVQLPGDALKISAEPLRIEFDRNTEMRAVMLKFTQAMIAQISQNVACNRVHELDRRCARWLLEVRDRVQDDSFPLTHEFIAEMLGVNRSSVTQAASNLKEKGIIEYSRGSIRIIDVPSLEAASCECYQVLQQEYDRLLGTNPPGNESEH
jgi:CRP-like cAMP-binding protein